MDEWKVLHYEVFENFSREAFGARRNHFHNQHLRHLYPSGIMKSQKVDDNLESREGGRGGGEQDKTPALVTWTPTSPSLLSFFLYLYFQKQTVVLSCDFLAVT